MTTSVPPEAPMKRNRKQRHTSWVLNNWTESDLLAVREYATKVRYMCWSQEVGEEKKTPHLQGYVAWDSPHSLAKFKKDLGGELHYGDKNGNTNGSAQANRAYCLGQVEKKGHIDNPTFEEYGQIPQQGERTDWAHAVADLQTGSDVASVIIEQPQLLPCVRALERFQTLQYKPLHRELNVIVLIGPPGSGKTRWAYDKYPDLFSKPKGSWWDGYSGQKTILLDDYTGEIPYDQLLCVLDRYPINLPVKGGYIWGQYTTVILTSNKSWQTWYGDTPPALALRALGRRINSCHTNSIPTDANEKDTSPSPSPSSTPKARRTVKAYIPKEIL